MEIRRMVTVVGLATALTVAAAPAWALDCNNQSRPAPDTSAGCIWIDGQGNGPCVYTIEGHWAYISFDANPADASWTFLPPGFVGPGNYQDGQGWGLLDNSAAVCNGARVAPGAGGSNTNGLVADPESLNTHAQPCRATS
jgi:hypothetical protein